MASKLWSFEFSVDTTFIIEVGENYFRFLKDHAYVLNGTLPYEVTTPYEEADLDTIQYKQINDVLFLTHPDYPPYKLSRIADDDWDLEQIVFDVPATLDENVDDDFTIEPSAKTGSITLTASDPLFDALHVGAMWRIGYTRDADTEEVAISGNNTSATLPILGPWNVRSYGVWTADLLVERQRSAGGPWEIVRRLISKSLRNVDVSGTAEENYNYRLRVENYVSNTDGRALIEASEAILWGTVEITAVGSPTDATATVLEDLFATDATNIWAEGAWSDYRGYPRAVTFHEGRIFYGGTTYQPLHIWGSVTDDFENFDRGTEDDASVVFQLASSEFNAIQWLVSQTDLIVGLAGGEWRVRGDRNGNIITPSRVDAKFQSKYGSEYQQPVVVGGQIIFVERRGRTLREMTYSYEVERLVSDTNLNLLAETITEAGIKQLAFSRVPIPTIWAVLNDGTAVALTYDREQNVVGWTRHDTDGLFLSVATSYGSPDTEDEVYFLVRRTINGETVDYIERLDSNRWEDKEDAFFVDCGLTIELEIQDTTVPGLDHLIGETVDALVDGKVYQGLVVDGSGNIELPSGSLAGFKWQVGLPYTSELSPFRFDADSRLGVHSGRIKRIDNVYARVFRSLGMAVDVDDTPVEILVPEGLEGADPDNPPLLGQDRPVDVKVPYSDGHTFDPTINITQTKPLPLSVMSISVGYEVSST